MAEIISFDPSTYLSRLILHGALHHPSHLIIEGFSRGTPFPDSTNFMLPPRNKLSRLPSDIEAPEAGVRYHRNNLRQHKVAATLKPFDTETMSLN
jgi:hypothetical protein